MPFKFQLVAFLKLHLDLIQAYLCASTSHQLPFTEFFVHGPVKSQHFKALQSSFKAKGLSCTLTLTRVFLLFFMPHIPPQLAHIYQNINDNFSSFMLFPEEWFLFVRSLYGSYFFALLQLTIQVLTHFPVIKQ